MDYYIVAYDISDPKRLHRIYKTMKDFGGRLQLSVFQCHLSLKNLVLMKEKIEKIISPQEDRILIIRCCPSCRERIETLGRQECEKEPWKTLVI